MDCLLETMVWNVLKCVKLAGRRHPAEWGRGGGGGVGLIGVSLHLSPCPHGLGEGGLGAAISSMNKYKLMYRIED